MIRFTSVRPSLDLLVNDMGHWREDGRGMFWKIFAIALLAWFSFNLVFLIISWRRSYQKRKAQQRTDDLAWAMTMIDFVASVAWGNSEKELP